MKKLPISGLFLLFLLALCYPAWCQEGGAGARDVPGLIKSLGNEDGAARSQARFALVRMGKDAVPGLIDALKERKNIPEIIYVLNSIKDDRSAGPLAKLLDLKDEESLSKVKAALFSLGPASMPYLFEAMKDPARRVPAASVLSGIKDPGHLTELYGILKEKDPGLRASAAAIERSWLDMGAKDIMSGLLSDEEPAVRREAALYFLDLSPKVTAPGLDKLIHDQDEAVRVTALKLAVKQRETGLAGGLVSVMKDDSSAEARRLAGDALYRCCPDKAVTPFIAALKDRDDTVAASAAGYLGELKAKDSLGPIKEMLTGRGEKPSDEVVEAVARAMADIGEGFDPDIFLPYINWENLYVVRSVLRAWEETARPGDAKMKEALQNYVGMQVDNRYKERCRRLIERLGP